MILTVEIQSILIRYCTKYVDINRYQYWQYTNVYKQFYVHHYRKIVGLQYQNVLKSEVDTGYAEIILMLIILNSTSKQSQCFYSNIY